MAQIIKVRTQKEPLWNREFFVINSESASPNLHLKAGVTYVFDVYTPGHPFAIKTAPILGELNLYASQGLSNNAVEQGTFTWYIEESETPQTLVYQSTYDPMMGSFVYLEKPQVELQNGMKTLGPDFQSLTIRDLVDALNHNAAIALTLQQDLAGIGLKMEGRSLRIDPSSFSSAYYRIADQIVQVNSELNINDLRFPEGDLPEGLANLQDYLDLIASILRAVKDPSKPYTDPVPTSVGELAQQVTTLQSRINSTREVYRGLVAQLRTLAQRYDAIETDYLKHKHDASDIVLGVIDPRRLGNGEPSADTVLIGSSHWVDKDAL